MGFHTFSSEWSRDGDGREESGGERGARQPRREVGQARACLGLQQSGTSFIEMQKGGSKGQVREENNNERPQNA